MPWALPVPGTATAAAPVIAMAIIAFVNIRIRCSPLVLFAASRKGAHRDNARSVGQFLLRPVAPLLTFDHGFGSSLTGSLKPHADHNLAVIRARKIGAYSTCGTPTSRI